MIRNHIQYGIGISSFFRDQGSDSTIFCGIRDQNLPHFWKFGYKMGSAMKKNIQPCRFERGHARSDSAGRFLGLVNTNKIEDIS